MKQRIKTEERLPENPAGEECSHFWTIEIANGPTSRGVCRICGEEKDFYNVIPDFSAQKKKGHPFDLPEIKKVRLNKDSKS